MFNVERIVTCTEVEGPYRRVAVWFQGCNIGCVGCCNLSITEFKVAHLIALEDLLKIILQSQIDNDIEGVTFSGGEPTLQKDLIHLCQKLKEHDIGTIMFTGRMIEDLPQDLINYIDLIIDGPFDIKRIDKSRRLIGSTNQRLLSISNRYKESLDWFLNKNTLIEEVNLADDIYIHGDATVDNEKVLSNHRQK